MTGRYTGILEMQGVIRGAQGVMPRFRRSPAGKVLGYADEMTALASTDDCDHFKVCRISPEVEARYGVEVVG